MSPKFSVEEFGKKGEVAFTLNGKDLVQTTIANGEVFVWVIDQGQRKHVMTWKQPYAAFTSEHEESVPW